MNNKIVAINFADNYKLTAVEDFNHIQEAIEHAAVNLRARYKVIMRFPRRTITGSVVVSLEIPDEIAEGFDIGRHLRGISNYLLKKYPDKYNSLLVGKRLLNYTEVKTYEPTRLEEEMKIVERLSEDTTVGRIPTTEDVEEPNGVLEELQEIKKELQNIRVILEYAHFPKAEGRFVNHKLVATNFDPEAHLADLRRSRGIDQ